MGRFGLGLSGSGHVQCELPWPSKLHGIENVMVLQLVKKFLSFSGIWMFITAFTAARYLSLPWATSSTNTPIVPPGIYFNIILLLRLGLQSGVSLRFPDQSPVFALPLPIRATCFTHCSLFDLWSIVNTVMNTEFPKRSRKFLHCCLRSFVFSGLNSECGALFTFLPFKCKRRCFVGLTCSAVWGFF